MDTPGAEDPIPIAGDLINSSLNLILQGIAETNRIGRRITITNVGMRFRIAMKGCDDCTSIALIHDTVRVMMVLDKQCNGAVATILGVLETADYQSFNNLSNSGRFRTLMDRTYELNYAGAAGDAVTTNNFVTPDVAVSDTFFAKVNIPVEYSGSGSVITAITSSNIFLLAISENAKCSFQGFSRIRFTDA